MSSIAVIMEEWLRHLENLYQQEPTQELANLYQMAFEETGRQWNLADKQMGASNGSS